MPSMDTTRKAVLWKQIYAALRAEILAKTLAPGVRMPSELELVDRYSVSRSTVRQALSNLENEGLVRIEQGRGSFVTDSIVRYAISPRTRYSENLLAQGRTPRKRRLAETIVAASQRVAEALQIPAGADVVRVHQINYANDLPIGAVVGYAPSSRFPDLLRVRRKLEDLTKVYAHYGIDSYYRHVTYITARLPTKEEARLLRQRRSVPVLETRKIDVDEDGRPIGYSENIWGSERVELVVPRDGEIGGPDRPGASSRGGAASIQGMSRHGTSVGS